MNYLKQRLFDLNIFTSKRQINKQAQKMLSNHPELISELESFTAFLDPIANTIPIRLYCVLHDISKTPRCKVCNKPTTFNHKGYFNSYCANSISPCASKDSDIINKRLATIKSRYGTNPMRGGILRDKYTKTMVERYGVEYPIQSSVIKEKMNQTMLERLGVQYAMQSDSVREKQTATNIERYGTPTFAESQISEKTRNILNDKSQFESLIQQFTIEELSIQLEVSNYTIQKYIDKHDLQQFTLSAKNINGSKQQQEICSLLDSLNIQYVLNERELIKPLQLDIYIPSHNIAIEFNGIFFHSEISGRDRRYHKNKLNECSKKQIRLIQIWSNEWLYKKEIVISRIKHSLGLNQNVIYARKTTIEQLSSKETKFFFDTNHIQGSAPASISFGLKMNGILVAAMSFVKSRFSKTIQWELQRYCTLIDFHVVGGAGKLLNHFIKSQKPESLISYCDVRWGTGNLYTTLGFKYSHTSNPNYFYFKRNGNTNMLSSRIMFQKHKLPQILDSFDPDITEWENMKNNGYDRIWDCGNKVYLYESV